MCEFVSWIEKDGKCYFLTAADLASKRGKQLIKHCKNDDDLVGHGAIRWFYGEFKGGKDRECTDFSSPNNFPREIVTAMLEGKFRGMGSPLAVLNRTALAKYEEIRRTARAKYKEIKQTAWAKYKEIEQAAIWDLITQAANRSRAWQ